MATKRRIFIIIPLLLTTFLIILAGKFYQQAKNELFVFADNALKEAVDIDLNRRYKTLNTYVLSQSSGKQKLPHENDTVIVQFQGKKDTTIITPAERAKNIDANNTKKRMEQTILNDIKTSIQPDSLNAIWQELLHQKTSLDIETSLHLFTTRQHNPIESIGENTFWKTYYLGSANEMILTASLSIPLYAPFVWKSFTFIFLFLSILLIIATSYQYFFRLRSTPNAPSDIQPLTKPNADTPVTPSFNPEKAHQITPDIFFEYTENKKKKSILFVKGDAYPVTEQSALILNSILKHPGYIISVIEIQELLGNWSKDSFHQAISRLRRLLKQNSGGTLELIRKPEEESYQLIIKAID